MVSLITKPELPNVDIDLNNDEDVNRYYNYICNGVDTVHTVQIQDVVIEKILLLVPYHLRDRFAYYTESLLIEIKDTYTRNIKKAILQYALQVPVQKYLLKVQLKFQFCLLYYILYMHCNFPLSKNMHFFSRKTMIKSRFT